MNFKKILLMSAVLAMTSLSAKAATIEFTIGDENFKTEYNHEVTDHVLEAVPFINESSRTMVPIRAISEAFGADVAWDEAARTVTVTNADKVIKLTIDSISAYVNDEESTLDCTPVIVNGRTFVPVRFISEAFSYNVNFASTTKQVIIDNSPIIVQCGDKTLSFAEFEELYNLFYCTLHDTAINSGATEEEIFEYSAQAALENSAMIVRIQNAFPNIPFTENDYTEIKIGIEEALKLYTPTLTGLNTSVTEKYYYSLGNTIIENYAATMDTESVYNSDYVCAKHILVEDEALAKDIYASLNRGADFDEAVTEYGTDPGMTENPDGYVFTKGDMVAEFEAAAFALKENEISEPVKSTYGYHIIKRMPLPEISEDLKLTIASQKANEVLENSAAPEFLMPEEELIDLIPRG